MQRTKTGYTRAAQQVLVSSALREGHEVISVVLHTDKPGIWEDSKALLTYGLVKVGCRAELSQTVLKKRREGRCCGRRRRSALRSVSVWAFAQCSLVG